MRRTGDHDGAVRWAYRSQVTWNDFYLADTMTVYQATRKAERVLPGKQAPEGQLDARWQAIIAVADHIEDHPDEVWSFARKWGAHASPDLRAAVATCLVEHLLEHHFDHIFPLVTEA